MKWLKLTILFLLVFSFDLKAQNGQNRIEEGFKMGNAELITTEMSEELELITPESEGTFSKDLSGKKLKAFFASNKIKGFEFIHQGKSPSGSAYRIGELQTEKGKFRVYILFSGKDRNKISELRIEADE
jgi:hypothetical protein